jgi:Undecaprenyl-phosphate galactose phosphotransferase WbaP
MCSLGASVRELGGEVGFEISQQLFHTNARVIKRTLDVALSLPALLGLGPLLAVLAVVIKISSPGPVFFGHVRLGRNGRNFAALKFRTMFQNGDALLEEHFKTHPEDFTLWQRDQKLRKDPRITPIGKWLRRLSLDELPQLWNVAIGEMSLVGPRPIVEAEVPKYGSGYELYSRVYPGITGLWQVSGRNNTTYQERVTLDEYYVRNWSIWLDLYILIRTFRTVLIADGAY